MTTPTINPAPYQEILETLEGKFYVDGFNQITKWFKDPDSANLLYVVGEMRTGVVGVLRPDGGFTAHLDQTILADTYKTAQILCHLGITDTTLCKPANMDTHYLLRSRRGQENLRVKTGNVVLYGEYVAPPHQYAGPYATPADLGLHCFVPEAYIPRNLPKVPRKVIAELRKHVEQQFKLAEIAAKVSGHAPNKYNMYALSNDNKTRQALVGNLKARGEMMVTTDAEFWRHARTHYTVAGIIDSCRAEFYNAAGVRPEPVAPPPVFVPKDTFTA